MRPAALAALKYFSADKKERDIANLVGPQTYQYILAECYPALRHSDYTVNYTVRGLSLEESKEIINKTGIVGVAAFG